MRPQRQHNFCGGEVCKLVVTGAWNPIDARVRNVVVSYARQRSEQAHMGMYLLGNRVENNPDVPIGHPGW